VYSFTTIIVCYTWLAHRTATIKLKDVNLGSHTIQQSEAAIGQSFSFFTYLTFWSLGFYFLVSSVHTYMDTFRKRAWLHTWPKPLQLAHSLFYSSITSFSFLVGIVFWGTMNSGWPAGRFEQWINISVHGLNSVFAIVEIILPATAAPPITHLSMVLLILSKYLGLAYLMGWTQDIYVYEWMNPAPGTVSIVPHVLGYAGGMLAIFVIVRYVIVERNMLVRKMSTRRSGNLQGKGYKLDDASDTWSARVDVEVPQQAGGNGRYVNQV
jgi:hypothetical protein